MSIRWLLLLSCCLLAACSLTKPVAMPEITKYTLNEVSHKQVGRTVPNTIFVSLTKANVGYQTNDLLYMKAPYELKSFARNSWNAPPASLMHVLIIESLRNAHLFRAVIAAPNSVSAEYRLDTALLKLQQDFSGSESHIDLMMEVSLVNTATSRMIAQKRLEVREPCAANPHAGVVAANVASKKIQEMMVDFVANHV